MNTKRQAWRPRPFGSLGPLSEMTVYGDTVYVTSGNYLSALQVGTGRTRWNALLPGNLVFAPAVSSDGVACLTEDGRLFFLNNRGQIASPYQASILDQAQQLAPTMVGDKIIVRQPLTEC